MDKISTVVSNRVEDFKADKLTVGLDLGDRFSHYCILNGAGDVIREQRMPTTPNVDCHDAGWSNRSCQVPDVIAPRVAGFWRVGRTMVCEWSCRADSWLEPALVAPLN